MAAPRYSAAQFTAAGFGGRRNRDVAAPKDGVFGSSTVSSMGRPLPLPSAVAGLIGQKAGVAHMGAFAGLS